jgi:hypothetical protein
MFTTSLVAATPRWVQKMHFLRVSAYADASSDPRRRLDGLEIKLIAPRQAHFLLAWLCDL